MGHNMMTTQKWYEHITNVIIGNTANFNSGCLDSIDYVDERKGVPLAELHPKSWTHPLQLTRCSFFYEQIYITLQIPSRTPLPAHTQPTAYRRSLLHLPNPPVDRLFMAWLYHIDFLRNGSSWSPLTSSQMVRPIWGPRSAFCVLSPSPSGKISPLLK